jgi:hypothetical protein
MKRMSIVRLCVLGALGVGAVTATAASAAALPELGRCVKVGAGGAFKYKNCIAPAAPGAGKFEWQPGPGAKPKFEAESGEVKLETVGGVKVNCLNVEVSGEYTGAKTATVSLLMNGCLQPTIIKSCQSNPFEQAQIRTTLPIEAELGFIEAGEHPKVGLDLKPKSSSTIVTFTCGGPPEEAGKGEEWKIEGSVIGGIKPLENMLSAFQLRYQQVAGKQLPEKFAGGPTDVLSAVRTIGTESKTEQAGLNTIGPETKWFSLENEEPLEIKAK